MKLFVCEFVTGGGLYREALPPSLAQEGGLMLEALLTDLAELPGMQLLTTRDARLPLLAHPVEQRRVTPELDVMALWDDCIATADAVWLIAPECGGVLEQLSRRVLAQGRRLLGSRPDAVAVAASKWRTVATLSAHGIPCVPTVRAGEALPASDAGWVAKPDDGAGCDDTSHFFDAAALAAWLGEHGRSRTHVVQPYRRGVPASLSMLCLDGRAWLLSCNRQDVALADGAFHYHGGVLNGIADHWAACERLAAAAARALPGLAGYVGVDVLVNEDAAGEACLEVLEVNPRLTTSYGGLRRATGANPARLALELFYNGRFDLSAALQRNVVTISLDA